MTTFALAAQRADATGLPVAEGFAVQLKTDAKVGSVSAAVTAALNVRLPGYQWTAKREGMPDRWLVCRPGTAADSVPSLGEAWEAVRALKMLSGVAGAEPLLLT